MKFAKWTDQNNASAITSMRNHILKRFNSIGDLNSFLSEIVQMDILSPSLFSLHSKGKGIEALTSLPNLIKEVKNKDFDEWREFIIEASGVSDAIDPFIVNFLHHFHCGHH